MKSRPTCCNPLTVAEGKKLRLVLDLRHPNRYVKTFDFKYEDLPHISQVLGPNQFYFSFDLESGYHHVDIFPPHQQYLGFSWVHNNSVVRYYVFTVLPFGLNSACYLFTKLTRPLVYYWRARGILSYIYIDDGLVISPNLSSALANLNLVRDTIARSGFVPSKTKCVWQPSNRIQYLGLVIDSITEQFFVPQSKIDKLLLCIDRISSLMNSQGSVPVKELASFAGQIISMSLALGPVCRLMTRASYRAIESRILWTDFITLPESVAKELRFWAENITVFNGFPFKFRLAPSALVFSDASDTGYGGYVQDHSNMRFHGEWTQAESLKSSTWRELAAVLRIISEGYPLFKNQKLKWFSDNANVPRIIKYGSVKPDLHDLALAIFDLCRVHNIVLNPEWLSRSENKLADKISRYQDYDDWSIDEISFSVIDSLWGPHTVDRFASPQNKKVATFNSRFWCKGTSGVDAFCQDWSRDNNYICPPVCLISQVIKRMASSMATATLVVPRWPSSYFWPIVCPDGSHLDLHVHDWRLLNVSFSPSSLGVANVFHENPSFLTLALRFDYKRPIRQNDRGFCCSELGYCSSCVH